jgi:hypothetical protein
MTVPSTMYPAVIGFFKAVFQAHGVNPKPWEMIVLRWVPLETTDKVRNESAPVT